MTNFGRLLSTAVLLGAMAQPAAAESYPNKPITLIATAAPGGVVDILARTLGRYLAAEWGQQVVVENKSGATNQIGAEYVAKSAPDGYVLLVTPEATFVVNPYVYSKLPYDPDRDFVPITGLVSISQALITNPSLPVENVRDLIELGKKAPGELTYGTFGVASTGHLNMEMLQGMSGAKFTAVHYKGATPALTDVIAGHIKMMFISTSSAVPPWRGGQVKMLGVGSKERIRQIPDRPTVAESGLPGFQAVSWFGLFAPHGTPNEVVDKINGAVRRIFEQPEFREKFLGENFYEPMVGSPQQFSQFIKTDALKWQKVIRDANVRVQ